MNKIILRADGGVSVSDVWAAANRAVARTESSNSGSSSSNSSSIWTSVLDNVGGWVNSVGGVITGSIQAKTGNYPAATPTDNTPKILAIAGVAAAVLIVILIIVLLIAKK